MNAADPDKLARLIDQHIAKRWDKVTPAPIADDAEFLRRIHLDLTGRIPLPRDLHEFLADRDPQKRRKAVDELLDSPRYAVHFANVWRSLLIPEVAADPDAKLFQVGFEAWLRQKLRANESFDKVVRELLAAPIGDSELVLRHPEKPNPLAFYAVKDASPANLAATTTRLFLGIQIECAQCHDHPFAAWSREQFWNQAAFFSGIARSGDGIFASLSEKNKFRQIAIGDSKKLASAIFLDGKPLVWKEQESPRVGLAEWVTSASNPYFARATANRLWGQLMGRGIVEPVDDFNDENKPSHPELLDDLANAFVESKFDLRFILRAICLSDAYQRTSARTDPSQDEPRHFARMTVKGLTGEQFFDSLAQAVGYREPTNDREFARDRSGVRVRFLEQFAPRGKLSDPETSILQALTLMNGKFINDATTVSRSSTLTAICEMPLATVADKIESLYLLTFSRKPTADERSKLESYVSRNGKEQMNRRLSDVFWMLLNSAEFRLNH